MKVQRTLRFGIIALAAASLWASAPLALAQRGGGVQALPDDQQALYRDFTTAVREASTAVTEKLTAARVELASAIFGAKVDEAAINGKAAAVAKLEAELYVIRAKEFDKQRAKLTNPELLALLKANAFQGGRGGGGGGGRRGQQ